MHHIKKTEKIHSCITSKGNFPFFLNFHPSRHGDWLITVQIYASAARVHRACLTQLCKSSTSTNIRLLKRLKISCWKNAREQKKGHVLMCLTQLRKSSTSTNICTRVCGVLFKRLKISCCRKNARKQKRGQAQLSGDGISYVHVNAVTGTILRTHRGKILLIFTVVLMIMVGIRC